MCAVNNEEDWVTSFPEVKNKSDISYLFLKAQANILQFLSGIMESKFCFLWYSFDHNSPPPFSKVFLLDECRLPGYDAM
jgi:hypothetical protein